MLRLFTVSQKEHKDKCREHEQLKRLLVKQKEDLAFFRSQLEERDRLIEVSTYTPRTVGKDLRRSRELDSCSFSRSMVYL